MADSNCQNKYKIGCYCCFVSLEKNNVILPNLVEYQLLKL